jgi:hypothetical protein
MKVDIYIKIKYQATRIGRNLKFDLWNQDEDYDVVVTE